MENENSQSSIFDKETTISQSAGGIVKLLVLMRVDKLLLAYGDYKNSVEGSGFFEKNKKKFQSSFYELLALLRPRMNKNKYSLLQELEEEIKSGSDESINIVFDYLENDLQLTKIATKRQYDRTNIEEENKDKGL